MKKKLSIVAAVTALILTVTALTGCTGDKDYYEQVIGYSFWMNKATEAIPQYRYYDIMQDYLEDGTLADGKVTKDGKTKKVLFVGWDGVQANGLINLLQDENSNEGNNYNYTSPYSGVDLLRKEGGLYLSYSGGEKGKDSEQSTSTSASWTSEFTGGWSNLHGIKENDHVKANNVDTIFMKYAKKGLHTSLAFDWGQLFEVNLRHELRQIVENPALPITYRDIDRAVAATDADRENELAHNLAEYNSVAMKTNLGEKVYDTEKEYDKTMYDYLLTRIDADDDLVAGIFHFPDTNGHSRGFTNDNYSYVNSIRNCDQYTYSLINYVKAREAAFNEEWLIIAATDHGGDVKGGHGKQIYECKTTWVACNKPIDSKYYGKNFNGMYEEN